MSYDPTITAARRAAKQHARDTNTPYQMALDAVAQRAGRSDWDAYLASPVPVPEGEDLYVNGEEHRHNQKAVLIAGAGTLPAAMTIPIMLSNGHSMTFWMTVQGMGAVVAFWTVATFGALMFFDIMSVHPDVEEIGENGTRMRHTSREMAQTAMAISTIMLIVGVLTLNLKNSNFPVAGSAAGISIALGWLATRIETPLTRRILALLAMNGALIAGIVNAGMMPR